IGIVAKEMDAGFEEEALRAQSVIARTNYLDAEKKGTKKPQGMSLEEMQEAFGDNFNKIYEKLKNCVNSTENEVLTWQEDYIYAAYHAVSSGSTRNMEELYGDVHMPYLSCQECHDDTTAEGYLAVCYWEKEEFLRLVNGAFPEAEAKDTSQIQVTARDKAEYVLTVQAGGISCGGEEFRSALGLNSACFTITETGENIRIVTRGIGHGFGLSQHMAQVFAEQGKDYREILTYFFPETELTQTEKIK
ncbi:MAG: SpoIID/LytB domain-containing protein, partial [Roseburia sp.]|nr:SpoIID/LytB domain-containing protein [Roseburia sp.]